MTVRRASSALAVLVTAAIGGALAGLALAAFIWTFESGIHVVWHTVPEHWGIDPFGPGWLFGILLLGGLLVGLGQRYLGDYPQPMEHIAHQWRQGRPPAPVTGPKTAFNALSALLAGGPVGFEAALTGILAAAATWIGGLIGSVHTVARQAWGVEEANLLPARLRHLPYWLAALSGLVTYRRLPFGGIDMGFRIKPGQDLLSVSQVLADFAMAAAVTVPAAWAVFLVARAEASKAHVRSPILYALSGGAIFALLALGSPEVLFSGQEGFSGLADLGSATLVYLVVAKVAALVIAFFTGWRGGPIFPVIFSAGALAILVDRWIGGGADVLTIAAIAAVGTVFLRGNIPAAFLLSLYVVPLAYSGTILVGALGAATVLVVAKEAGWTPPEKDTTGHAVEV